MDRRGAGMGPMMPFFPGPGINEQPGAIPPNPDMPPFPHMRERFPNSVWGPEGTTQNQWGAFHPPGLAPPMAPPGHPPHQYNQFEPRQAVFNFSAGAPPQNAAAPNTQFSNGFPAQYNGNPETGPGYVPQGHFSPQTTQNSVPYSGTPNGFLPHAQANNGMMNANTTPHTHQYPQSNDYQQSQQTLFKSPHPSPVVSTAEPQTVQGGFTVSSMPSPHNTNSHSEQAVIPASVACQIPNYASHVDCAVPVAQASPRSNVATCNSMGTNNNGNATVQSRLKTMIMSRQGSGGNQGTYSPSALTESPPPGELRFSGSVAAVTSVESNSEAQESLKMAQNFLAYRTTESGPGSVVQHPSEEKGIFDTQKDAKATNDAQVEKDLAANNINSETNDSLMINQSSESTFNKKNEFKQPEETLEELFNGPQGAAPNLMPGLNQSNSVINNQMYSRMNYSANEAPGPPKGNNQCQDGSYDSSFNREGSLHDSNDENRQDKSEKVFTHNQFESYGSQEQQKPLSKGRIGDKANLSVYDFPDSPDQQSVSRCSDFRSGRVRGTGLPTMTTSNMHCRPVCVSTSFCGSNIHSGTHVGESVRGNDGNELKDKKDSPPSSLSSPQPFNSHVPSVSAIPSRSPQINNLPTTTVNSCSTIPSIGRQDHFHKPVISIQSDNPKATTDKNEPGKSVSKSGHFTQMSTQTTESMCNMPKPTFFPGPTRPQNLFNPYYSYGYQMPGAQSQGHNSVSYFMANNTQHGPQSYMTQVSSGMPPRPQNSFAAQSFFNNFQSQNQGKSQNALDNSQNNPSQTQTPPKQSPQAVDNQMQNMTQPSPQASPKSLPRQSPQAHTMPHTSPSAHIQQMNQLSLSSPLGMLQNINQSQSVNTSHPHQMSHTPVQSPQKLTPGIPQTPQHSHVPLGSQNMTNPSPQGLSHTSPQNMPHPSPQNVPHPSPQSVPHPSPSNIPHQSPQNAPQQSPQTGMPPPSPQTALPTPSPQAGIPQVSPHIGMPANAQPSNHISMQANVLQHMNMACQSGDPNSSQQPAMQQQPGPAYHNFPQNSNAMMPPGNMPRPPISVAHMPPQSMVQVSQHNNQPMNPSYPCNYPPYGGHFQQMNPNFQQRMYSPMHIVPGNQPFQNCQHPIKGMSNIGIPQNMMQPCPQPAPAPKSRSKKSTPKKPRKRETKSQKQKQQKEEIEKIQVQEPCQPTPQQFPYFMNKEAMFGPNPMFYPNNQQVVRPPWIQPDGQAANIQPPVPKDNFPVQYQMPQNWTMPLNPAKNNECIPPNSQIRPPVPFEMQNKIQPPFAQEFPNPMNGPILHKKENDKVKSPVKHELQSQGMNNVNLVPQENLFRPHNPHENPFPHMHESFNQQKPHENTFPQQTLIQNPMMDAIKEEVKKPEPPTIPKQEIKKEVDFPSEETSPNVKQESTVSFNKAGEELGCTIKKEETKSPMYFSSINMLDKEEIKKRMITNEQILPQCSCSIPPGTPDCGPVYTHLGAGSSVAAIRDQIQSRTGLKESEVRIEKVIYSGKEGKTESGCPLAKWIIRRSGPEEKLLVIVKRRMEHTCDSAWIVVVLVSWDAIVKDMADDLYSMLVNKLNKFGNPTERRCGTNEDRTCACQGEDPKTCGASFSFGCSWSMYYNMCKFARSKNSRKFKLNDEKEEKEVEEKLQNIATTLSPIYERIAPAAFHNQIAMEDDSLECRLGNAPGRPWTGVTACLDFCSHAHKDSHNIHNGCTVIANLTKNQDVQSQNQSSDLGPKALSDEQLHVLPLYVLDSKDEEGPYGSFEQKINSGSIEVLSKYPFPMRLRSEPLLSCRARNLLARGLPLPNSIRGKAKAKAKIVSLAGLRRKSTDDSPHRKQKSEVKEVSDKLGLDVDLLLASGDFEDSYDDFSKYSIDSDDYSWILDIGGDESKKNNKKNEEKSEMPPPHSPAPRRQPSPQVTSPSPSPVSHDSPPPVLTPAPSFSPFSPQMPNLSPHGEDSSDSDVNKPSQPIPSVPVTLSEHPTLSVAHTSLFTSSPEMPKLSPHVSLGAFSPGMREKVSGLAHNKLTVKQTSSGSISCPQPETKTSESNKQAVNCQMNEGETKSQIYTRYSDNVQCFKDSNFGGVAIALTHGSVLFEYARQELHSTTALRNPNRTEPQRISLVFYHHKNLIYRHHGIKELETKMEKKRIAANKVEKEPKPKPSPKKRKPSKKKDAKDKIEPINGIKRMKFDDETMMPVGMPDLKNNIIGNNPSNMFSPGQHHMPNPELVSPPISYGNFPHPTFSDSKSFNPSAQKNITAPSFTMTSKSPHLATSQSPSLDPFPQKQIPTSEQNFTSVPNSNHSSVIPPFNTNIQEFNPYNNRGSSPYHGHFSPYMDMQNNSGFSSYQHSGFFPKSHAPPTANYNATTYVPQPFYGLTPPYSPGPQAPPHPGQPQMQYPQGGLQSTNPFDDTNRGAPIAPTSTWPQMRHPPGFPMHGPYAPWPGS